jgi:hypothetical protein
VATKKLNLLQIISGGQTGADQGALLAARELGIPTGGTAPQDWWTETGCQEQLLRGFGLVECTKPGYDARTRQNVLDGDATLIVGSEATGGSALTASFARHVGKPLLLVPFPSTPDTPAMETLCKEFREWLTRSAVRTLNVAGNRESERAGIQEFTTSFLVSALVTKSP